MATAQADQQTFNVLLVGCGKMGGALLKGWLNARIIDTAYILDPAFDALQFDEDRRIKHIDTLSSTQTYDIVMLATKPQIMDPLCEEIAPHISKDSVILSIAAGKPISAFEKHFGADQPVIRTMPNTPAAIGKGITALIANGKVAVYQKKAAQSLMGVSGQTLWVDDEDDFHAITALSGSGPAYIFLMIETLTKAGIEMGLDEKTATTLARQTVIGSAALAESEHQTPASTLRENVTSPGGTTAAALEILMDGELEALFKKALKAAQERSRELG